METAKYLRKVVCIVDKCSLTIKEVLCEFDVDFVFWHELSRVDLKAWLLYSFKTLEWLIFNTAALNHMPLPIH